MAPYVDQKCYKAVFDEKWQQQKTEKKKKPVRICCLVILH